MCCRSKGVRRGGHETDTTEMVGESRLSSVGFRVVAFPHVVVLPLCLFIPSINTRPVHAENRAQAGIPTPTKTKCRCNNHAPSRKKGNRQIQPATLRPFPDRPYPSLFFARKKTAQATPTLPSENMPRAPNTPLEKQIFSVVAPPPHGTPIAPTRRAMNESHISRLHVPQAIHASFPPYRQ